MTKQEIQNKITSLQKRIEQNKKDLEYYDLNQTILKVLINRVYGAFANQYSPFCDVDAAASITLTGQACIKQASKIINKHVKDKYDIDEDICLYVDTDSNYYTIKPVLEKLNKDYFTQSGEISKTVYDIEKEFSEVLNGGINDWAVNNLNSVDPRLFFKREAICDTAIFIQKKRYIMHIMNLDGFKVDKYKYVGVEVQRSDIPKKTKHYIKDVVETMLSTKDYKKTNEVFNNTFEDFKSLNIEDISYPRGLHNFDKYNNKADGLKIGLHTPVHAKAAIYYNYLLDNFNLKSKYEKIRGDTKMKWFYAKKNKFGMSVVGYLDKYPIEFEIEVDHDKMFSKIIGAAIERLYEAIGWRYKNPNHQEVVDLFDLLT